METLRNIFRSVSLMPAGSHGQVITDTLMLLSHAEPQITPKTPTAFA